MSKRHAFEPLAASPDACGYLENVGDGAPLLVPCRMPRAAAVHDVFSSNAAHPGLAVLKPSARLAALLGCTVDELAESLRELVGVRSVGELAPPDSGEVVAFARAKTEGAVTAWRCAAAVDDDCRCERAPGHRGKHAHLNEVWTTYAGSTFVRQRERRCFAVCTTPSAKLATYRCVLELDHEGETHELDNGEVFR